MHCHQSRVSNRYSLALEKRAHPTCAGASLVQERDLIAYMDRALDQHRAVHANTPFVRLRDRLQNLGARLSGVGIERDYLAAGIALENRDPGHLARHPGLQPRPRRASRRRHCHHPSHNPPEDGGFKYNPTNGGPADTDVTEWVENRANELLRNGNAGVKRVGFTTAFNADTTHQEDFVLPYVNDLRNVVDMEAIRAAGLELAVDPLGGAAVHYWEPINAVYKLNIAVVNPRVDPTFSFMTVDHDGEIFAVRRQFSETGSLVP